MVIRVLIGCSLKSVWDHLLSYNNKKEVWIQVSVDGNHSPYQNFIWYEDFNPTLWQFKTNLDYVHIVYIGNRFSPNC